MSTTTKALIFAAILIAACLLIWFLKPSETVYETNVELERQFQDYQVQLKKTKEENALLNEKLAQKDSAIAEIKRNKSQIKIIYATKKATLRNASIDSVASVVLPILSGAQDSPQ